jgi:hypothetical protein
MKRVEHNICGASLYQIRARFEYFHAFLVLPANFCDAGRLQRSFVAVRVTMIHIGLDFFLPLRNCCVQNE